MVKQPQLLEIKNLSCYRGPVKALRGISLEAKSGETVCLIGANGSGRSSLILCIMGLISIHEGEIYFEGTLINNLFPHQVFSKGITFVPEDRRVFPDLTVKENLELGKKKGKQQDNGKIDFDTIMDIFPPLSKLINRKGVFLSGGEQKMVAIARSLISSPKLILLDEPLEGLAPALIDRFVDSLERIKELGVTVIQAESNINLGKKVAEKFVGLERGEIFFVGSPEELENNAAAKEKIIGLH